MFGKLNDCCTSGKYIIHYFHLLLICSQGAQAAAQPQQFAAPYAAMPVCYAPVCCAPQMTTPTHVPVNRWTAAYPAPTPCSCAPGLQVLTSCDGVACTSSHMPFVHFHGVSVPYHCPHVHTSHHRLPPPPAPSAPASVAAVPVSFASSVYQTSALFHQQHHRVQQPTGYHHQMQSHHQQPASYHGQPAPAQNMPGYHAAQVPHQQPTGFSGNGHHQQQVQAPPSYPAHHHQMAAQSTVFHQSPRYITTPVQVLIISIHFSTFFAPLLLIYLVFATRRNNGF